jgi:protein TonB
MNRNPMSDSREYSRLAGQHRPPPVLLLALLFSVAVHAAAGGLLFNNWPWLPAEPPQPLTVTVTLEAAPPSMIGSTPPQAERNPVPRAASNRVVPVQPVHHAPAPGPTVMERVEAALPAVTPAPENAPAPTLIAKAQAPVSSSGRADAIEPPHFNVAYLNNPRPAYPPIARKLGLEGLVVLRVQVSANGAPEQVAVTQTSGAPVLDEAALKAVQGWTFVPARRGDTPVAHVVDVPVRFQLKN